MIGLDEISQDRVSSSFKESKTVQLTPSRQSTNAKSPLRSPQSKKSLLFKSPTNKDILKTLQSPIIKRVSKLQQVSQSMKQLPYVPTGGQSKNVQVVIRVRPLNEREKTQGQQKSCLAVDEQSKITLDRGMDVKTFTFDYVANQDSTQEEIFLKIAQPIADSCLQGYNGTIFAYGQTGSGKTFTIQGPGIMSANGEEQIVSALNATGKEFEMRGIMQRSFEYIFAQIEREQTEAEQNGSEVKYLIKTSYLEIYNEQVMDLLDPGSFNLLVREDIKTGVYVEGLVEEPVASVREMIALITRGSRNRHVGSTSMNKESSRSHSVLTTQIESKTMNASGVWQMKSSCFHIIDLAGSERSKHTNAEGQRLKEAGMINKSLSALGIVINSLVDISEGKTRHVHYRDSKLTFLLRDSLGGNSKTVIIANVTSAQNSVGETLSTLQFAQRAKLIKNKAVINEESSGTIQLLKSEIRRLKQELAEYAQNPIASVCQLCKAESSEPAIEFKDEMLVTGADSKRPNDRIKQLESLLAANLESLTQSQKYFDSELDKKSQSYTRMQQALESMEKQSQRDKMVIKFRDQRIIKLEQALTKDQSQCNQCELLQEQVEELKRENQELREMYDSQCSSMATKLFAEKEELRRVNLQLSQEIKMTPESLGAQVRLMNDLTDSLTQYLKEHLEPESTAIYPQTIEPNSQALSQSQQLDELAPQLQLKSEQVDEIGLQLTNFKQEQAIIVSGYEQVTQQLKLKCSQFEQQVQQYKDQSDALNSQLLDKSHESDQLKQSLSVQQKACDQLRDEIRIVQSELSLKQDQYLELQTRYDVQCSEFTQLQSQLDSVVQSNDITVARLQEQLLSQYTEHQSLLHKVSILSQSNQSLAEQLKQTESQLQESCDEVGKMQAQLKSAQEETMLMQQKCSDLVENSKLSEEALSQELQGLRMQVEQMARENHALQAVIAQESDTKSKLSEQLCQQKTDFSSQILTLQSQLQSSNQSIASLNQSYQQLEQQKYSQQQLIDKLESDLLSQQQEHQQSLTKLEIMLESQVQDQSRKQLSSLQEFDSLKTQLIRANKEVESLQIELLNLNKQLDLSKTQSDTQVGQMTAKYQEMVAEFEQQIQSCELRYVQMQSHYQQQVLAAQNEVYKVNQQLDQCRTSHTQMEQSYQSQQSQLEEQLSQLKANKQQTSQQLLQSNDTITQYKQRVQELTVQLGQSQGKCKDVVGQMEQMATKGQLRVARLENQLREKDIQIVGLQTGSAELESKIKEMQSKVELGYEMQKRIHLLESKVAVQKGRFAGVMNVLEGLKSDLKGLRQISFQDFKPQLMQFAKLMQDMANQKIKQANLTIQQRDSQILDSKHQLQEYKNLAHQLQSEKQHQINQSTQLCVKLEQAESQLIQLLEEQESLELQAKCLAGEVDILRHEKHDLQLDLSKTKSKLSDLQQALGRSKDTVQMLVDKESQLVEELEVKMGELGQNQNEWKQKVGEQKLVIQEQQSQIKQLRDRYEMLVNGREQLQKEREQGRVKELEQEVVVLKQTVQKRELEIKEVVKTLKKFSDDKKLLEQENALLLRQKDDSQGHQNLQQKIQHHLKIKEENNKLREENYGLKEDARRGVSVIQECLDTVLETLLAAPGTSAMLKQTKLSDQLHAVSGQACSASQIAQQCRTKAFVMQEIIGNLSRNFSEQAKKLPPSDFKRPAIDAKTDSQNKVNSAALYLTSVQRSSSQRK